jgi:transposase
MQAGARKALGSRPMTQLKLYLYGYINQVGSSRRLEREACRNLELIRLLKNLRPGYRTIVNFRKENWEALKATNRGFVLLARELAVRSPTRDPGPMNASKPTERQII